MKKTVMIVDDEAPTRQLVQDVMTNEGYKVMAAFNGKDCLDQLKKQKPDIILLDIMMPDVNGWDTAAQIKTDKTLEKIPIIFLTAKTDVTSKMFGKMTAEYYIEKPFEIDNIISLVKTVLSKKK